MSIKFLGLLTEEFETRFVLADLRQAMAAFGQYERLDFAKGSPPPPEKLAAAITDADVVISGWPTPMLPLSVLTNPTCRLKYICNLTGGVRHMLPRTYLERGIPVTNWGETGVWSFAEGGLALMLGCLKAMHRIRPHMQVHPGEEFPFPHPAPTLREKVIGFIGYGAISRILHGMLRPMLCREFIAYGHHPLPEDVRRATLDEVFAEADIITVQCGMTAQTRHMISRQQLDRLKPHAILINTARGGIINEKDLIEFLRARPDVTAGLDVYEQEPLPADNPLPHLDNVICYPHCVGLCGDLYSRLVSRTAAENIRNFCTGQPLKAVITLERYDLMS